MKAKAGPAELAHRHRLAELGLLSVGLAHQLRHSFTALVGLSEVLLQSLSEPPRRGARRAEPQAVSSLPGAPAPESMEARREALLLRRESLRGMRLVRLLLEYVRAGGEREGGAVALEEVIADAVSLWRLQSLSEGVRLEVLTLAGELQVPGPGLLLQQTLLNLFMNASEALAGVEREGCIRVAAWRREQQVIVEVVDNGPGIPEELQARLFEPLESGGDDSAANGDPRAGARPGGEEDFARGKDGNAHPPAENRPEAGRAEASGRWVQNLEAAGHAGLGLYLCRWLMRQLGGEIGLRLSRPGETVFQLRLPVEGFAGDRVLPPPRTRLHAAPAPERAGLQRRPLRVLVVEDEPSIVEFLHVAFRRRGDRVSTAASFARARRALLHGNWDLVLLDWRVGEEQAPALLAWLDRLRPELSARVVLLTGDVSPTIRECAHRRGLCYLEKPFTLAELWELTGNFFVVTEENSSRAA